MNCEHENFRADVAVGRLTKTEGGAVTHYVAEVEVKCTQCGVPFYFLGVPIGYSAYRPTSDFTGTKLSVPVTPPGVMPPENIPGYMLMQPKETQ